MTAALGPMLFGKLPAHGDFVCRGLDEPARVAWDAWTSAGLDEAREALGDGFETAHEAAPPWRFVLAPGDLGETWRAGALTPSVDRSGRRFVLMLAADGWAPETAAGAVAEAMEGAIYHAFEAGLDADGLIDHARACRGASAAAPAELRARWWTLGGPAHAARSLEGPTPADLLTLALTPDTRALP